MNKINSNNIVIGTANFSMEYGLKNQKKKLSIKKKEKIIKFLKKNKLTFFDTSQEYADCENYLGNCNLKKNIITKVLFKKKIITKEYVKCLVDSSLKKLKEKKLYALLFHNPKDLAGERGKKIFKLLKAEKKLGKIKKIGISINKPGDIKIFHNKYPIDLIQIPINVFDQRLIESGILKKLKKNNIEIHARSIFLQGSLLMKINNLPSYFNKFKKHFIKWEKFIKDNNLKKIEACINFIKQFNIDKIVIGIDNKNQLDQIMKIKNYSHKLNFDDLSVNDLKLIFPKYWKINY